MWFSGKMLLSRHKAVDLSPDSRLSFGGEGLRNFEMGNGRKFLKSQHTDGRKGRMFLSPVWAT